MHELLFCYSSTKHLTTFLTILLYGCLVDGKPMLLNEPMINEVSRIFRAFGASPSFLIARRGRDAELQRQASEPGA